MAWWVIETTIGFIYGLEAYSYEGKQKTVADVLKQSES